jgi:hypothetical protein
LLDNLHDWSNRKITFGDFEILSSGPDLQAYLDQNLLYQYWRDKGGPEQKIARADINPADLKTILRHMVIMDITPGQSPFSPEKIIPSAQHDFTVKVRLIGTFVADFYGEITGKDVYQMQHELAANRIYHMSSMVRSTGTPHLSIIKGYTDGKEHLKSYALYLPLFEKPPDSNSRAISKILVYVDIVTLNDQAI